MKLLKAKGDERLIKQYNKYCIKALLIMDLTCFIFLIINLFNIEKNIEYIIVYIGIILATVIFLLIKAILSGVGVVNFFKGRDEAIKQYRDESFRNAFYLGWFIALGLLFFKIKEGNFNYGLIQFVYVIPLFYIIFKQVMNGEYLINIGKRKFGLNKNLWLRLFIIGICVIIGLFIGAYKKGFNHIIIILLITSGIFIFIIGVIFLLSRISENRADKNL